ncbi:hypothetical protein Taro_018508, partial [Colocasia esculenta]|nr:hypothetical protein [Colocasia esculenta]
GCRQAAHSYRQASLPELWITEIVCICRQPSCCCRKVHTVQQAKALSAAICRQALLGCRRIDSHLVVYEVCKHRRRCLAKT